MSTDSPSSPKRHFADLAPDTTLDAHFFEQLNLDLNWATDNIQEYQKKNGLDSLTALEASFHNIAGRRWNRFKEAEKQGNEKRAVEMKYFASFWYRLTAKIATVKPD